MAGRLFQRPGNPQHEFPAQLGSDPISKQATFVSNAAMPQIANYWLVAGLGFFAAAVFTPQGPAQSAEYTFGTHAQALHQAEALKTQVRGSVRTPPAAPVSSIGQFIKAAPDNIDLSISSWVVGGAPMAQGPVPPFALATSQTDPSQIAAQVWKSVRTPPITAGVLGAYISQPPQQADFTLQARFSKPLIVGQSGVPPFISGKPQDDTTQRQALVWASQPAAPITANPIASFFVTPPQNEERPSRQVFPSQTAGQTTPVIKSVYAAPQLYDFTQQPVITPAAITQVVIITGTTVFPNAPVPPQTDTTVNPSVVWTPSTFSPSGPIPPTPPVIVVTDSGGARHDTVRHRHEKTLVEREKERRKLFRKKKIRFALPPEQQEIVEKAVQTAAEAPESDAALKAKVTYLEELTRWLGEAEKATAKTLEDLFALDVEQRVQEMDLQEEEEEAIAILTAWWMNGA